MQRGLIVSTLVLFGALSGAALWRHGYWGIVEPHFRTLGAAQVFADLVIALVLVMVWMWRDARAVGRRPWPWILATLALGSWQIGLYESCERMTLVISSPAGARYRCAVK